jgi:hypothetical protein
MKRFVLYLVFVPIIGPLVVGIWQALIWPSFYSLSVTLLHLPRAVVATALVWLLPALAIATADRLLSSNKWQRLTTIVAVGCVSTLLADFAFYGLPVRDWLWNDLLMFLYGGTAALVSCVFVDQLEEERLRKFGSTIRNGIKVLRRWPNPVED